MAEQAWFKLLTIIVLAGSALTLLFVDNRYAIAGVFGVLGLYLVLLTFASRGKGDDKNGKKE